MAAETCVAFQINKALNCLTSSVVAALTPPREYYVLILHRRMNGKQTD
jgi:hypothetical protein